MCHSNKMNKEMNPPVASIIVRTFNEEKYIDRLLKAIFQQFFDNFEVILVDSGSTDATISIAKRYPVKIVSLNPENFSFGRSLNIGCQCASGDFLVFLSGHVYPTKSDWLENLLKMFKDPKVALVYGKQRGDNPVTKFSEHRIFEKLFPDKSIPVQNTPFYNNANAAIRRNLWEKMTYNEILPGLEDLDWAKRTIERGYYISYSADAEIIHTHNENLSRILNRYKREAIALKTIFPNESFGFFEFLGLLLSNIFSDLRQAYKQKTFKQHFFEIILFRFMQMYGTYSGFRFKKTLSKEMKMKFYYPLRK